MKLLKLICVAIFTAFFGRAERLMAQDYIPIFSQDYSSRLSVEIDPATFLLSGYSFHLRYQPMFSEKFLIGAGSYGLDLPDIFVNLNEQNRDQGWNVRIKSAYSIFAELYFKQANQGWFVGEQIGFQNYKISNANELNGSSRFNNILFMTYLGYSWHPYKGSFYIKPWAGLGLTDKVDGINKIGSLQYDISPVFLFLTFHVGYTF